MPVARFVCPYCEKDAEVQVTSVTRSRPCPHCNRGVMIQVAARDRKGKHRALLITADGAPLVIDESDLKPEQRLAYEPKPLEGEVFERMKMDPEIQVFRQRLVWGLVVVALLILASIFWPQGSREEVVATVVPSQASTAEKPEAALPAPSVSSSQPSQSDPKLAAGHNEQANKEVPRVIPPSPAPKSGVLNFTAAGGSGEGEPAKETKPAGAGVLESKEIVEKFLRAGSLDELLETVAMRSEVELLIRKHFSGRGVSPIAYEKIEPLPASQVAAGFRSAVAVTLNDGTRRVASLLMEAKGLRVDWPSFAAWSEMAWADFIKNAPAKPSLFRVLVTEESRFDHAFAESSALRCVKLQDPNNAAGLPLFGYAEKSSTAAEELDFLLRESLERPLRLTVRLRYPMDPATRDQVWIDGVVAHGWAIEGGQIAPQALAQP